MDNIITINTGIKKYKIEDENGEILAILKVDTNDATILDRFLRLRENTLAIAKNTEQRLKNFDIDTANNDDMRRVSEISKDALNELVVETNALCGEDFVEQVYKANYEVNPNFVPSIAAMSDLFNAILPLMQDAMKKGAGKYSPNKVGGN